LGTQRDLPQKTFDFFYSGRFVSKSPPQDEGRRAAGVFFSSPAELAAVVWMTEDYVWSWEFYGDAG
jgi:hypothetical protein